MARASVQRDKRGDVYVVLSATINGKRERLYRRVPGNDEAVAEEVAEAWNRRFLVGDLSAFSEAVVTRKRDRAWRRASGRRGIGRAHGSLERWRERYVDSLRGVIGEHTWRSYRSSIAAAVEILGRDRDLESLVPGDLVELRSALVRAGRAERTIDDTLAAVRRMLDAAVLAGVLEANPFAVRLVGRKTKRRRAAARASSVAKRPLDAEELGRLLELLRKPPEAKPREAAAYPLTEALALTGLRFGEVAALRWSVVDWERGRVAIIRARERYGPADPANPTKTGAEWSIPLRAPLLELLRRQRERVYLADPDGWIFPTATGACARYSNWRKLWVEIRRRAKLPESSGDSQKLLRKSYLTSSLVCGRNPKRVAGEVGHASLRMLTDQYEIFIDPASWPSDAETSRLVGIYGFDDVAASAEASGESEEEGRG